MTHLLITGDVHGALAELLGILHSLEERYGPIAGILQAGDLGVFGHDSVLDKATRRFATEDPTELGIAPYVAGEKVADRPVWFTRGNHEDFDLLRRLGSVIDPPGFIRHLPDAEMTDVHALRVLSIGGIDGAGLESPPERGGKYFRADEVEEAAILCPDPDILLTHAGPEGYSVNDSTIRGSRGLLDLVLATRPRWHFFGHHSHPPRPAQLGESWIVPLNQPDVLHVPGRDGGIGFLDIENREFWFVLPDLSLCQLSDLRTR